MNQKEIKKAKRLLADNAERFSTAICGSGQCLTAYWYGGGQRVFGAIEQVADWIAEKAK